ncbi:DUF2069 domain-containing protein [Ideonella sp.]|uniref:DUF2069 domain-containing protein n=1 Tax=Ideonella sp. TaxID=1929293 RepID=UPI0035AF5E0A
MMPPDSHPSAPHGRVLPPDGLTRLTRLLAIGLLLALVAHGLAWELWWAPTGRGTLAIKVLPLLAALPGLWRWRMYTYRWLSLLVWLYVAEGLVRLGGDSAVSARLAALQALLAVALFAACAAHVRWRLRRAAASSTTA